MSIYTLITNVTAVQSAPGTTQGNPAPTNLPAGSIAVNVQGGAGGPNFPTLEQSFQVNLNGSGAISATVQPLVSNDGINWLTYGGPITLSGTGPQVAGGFASQNWKWFSAYVTAISGTNASATCIMSA